MPHLFTVYVPVWMEFTNFLEKYITDLEITTAIYICSILWCRLLWYCSCQSNGCYCIYFKIFPNWDVKTDLQWGAMGLSPSHSYSHLQSAQLTKSVNSQETYFPLYALVPYRRIEVYYNTVAINIWYNHLNNKISL